MGQLLLLEDFNSQVGCDSIEWHVDFRPHGISSINTNDNLLLHLCASHKLSLTRTLFQLDKRYLTTCTQPRSAQSTSSLDSGKCERYSIRAWCAMLYVTSTTSCPEPCCFSKIVQPFISDSQSKGVGWLLRNYRKPVSTKWYTPKSTMLFDKPCMLFSGIIWRCNLRKQPTDVVELG